MTSFYRQWNWGSQRLGDSPMFHSLQVPCFFHLSQYLSFEHFTKLTDLKNKVKPCNSLCCSGVAVSLSSDELSPHFSELWVPVAHHTLEVTKCWCHGSSNRQHHSGTDVPWSPDMLGQAAVHVKRCPARPWLLGLLMPVILPWLMQV